jgi:hypothetical protein
MTPRSLSAYPRGPSHFGFGIDYDFQLDRALAACVGCERSIDRSGEVTGEVADANRNDVDDLVDIRATTTPTGFATRRRAAAPAAGRAV